MKTHLFLATLAVVSVFAQTTPAAEDAPRPNIIIILSDDMGYSDIGCYGGEIQTPTLNALAEDGLRFTQFYNTARCCPTRASLLTGLYPHQAGVGHMLQSLPYEGYTNGLNRHCVTIAEAVKPAGYRTYMAGKWHVTNQVKPGADKSNWPLQRGFDRFYGTIHGAGSFYDPNSLTRDNTLITPVNDPEYQSETFYYTDAISDNAVRYIDDHAKQNAGEPFFMYVAYTAAHWPMHALPHDIAKYSGRYDDGYGAIRVERYERMKQMGLIKPEWELSPQAEDWNAVKPEDLAWERRCMEVYAAMVDSMDQGIGRIVGALDRNGMRENTLVFFLQDNGGCAEGMGRTSRGEWKTRPDEPPFEPMGRDELQLDMIPKQTRDGYPTVMGKGIMPGPDGTYHGYGRGWANVSNTPFREYKHWVHEGGISTPLIAHWPKGIKRCGEYDHQPGHLIDLMATCVDLSGAEYPTERSGEFIRPMEGRSLVPAFDGGAIQRDAIYWEHEGNRAVRVGPWKLVAKSATGPWELYNIDDDRSEMHNLAAEMPEKVEELAAKWQAYAERAQVLPLVPYYGGAKKETFSKKKSFKLSAGDDLPRESAPMVVGKDVVISVTVDDPTCDGALLAHGGSRFGYALYVKDGKVQFATRHESKQAIVAADQPLPAKPTTLHVAYGKNGTVTISTEGCPIAQGKTPGSQPEMPADGLQVGQDLAGCVGDYAEPFTYGGKIESATVEVR